mmetsp:Transcript_56709/g.93782  ORF Transcript_56709/g.93782 Transcript_56709/m.93782 type:complete len:212 (+) Transcript_56709:619-1254(+)
MSGEDGVRSSCETENALPGDAARSRAWRLHRSLWLHTCKAATRAILHRGRSGGCAERALRDHQRVAPNWPDACSYRPTHNVHLGFVRPARCYDKAFDLPAPRRRDLPSVTLTASALGLFFWNEPRRGHPTQNVRFARRRQHVALLHPQRVPHARARQARRVVAACSRVDRTACARALWQGPRTHRARLCQPELGRHRGPSEGARAGEAHGA